MSFMFNPSRYDEWSAINKIDANFQGNKIFKKGTAVIAAFLANLSAEKPIVYGFDGYSTAEFSPLVNLLSAQLTLKGIKNVVINVSDYYKDSKTLELEFSELLPNDRKKDPVLLFGKRITGGYETIFDRAQYMKLIKEIEELKKQEYAVVLYGFGSTFSEKLRSLIDKIIFLDMIPKEVVLRAKAGKSKNLGDKYARPFKEMMRRNYYIDFELALNLRSFLLENGLIDFYVDSTNELKLLSKDLLFGLCDKLSKKPFRPKPVYIEGVWGGQFVKRQRNVPDICKNIAWVFDFIPMEVSVAIQFDDELIDIPFYTFLRTKGKEIMGQLCEEKFKGYFPIRFNYDDTFHSSGNMSIQCHSGGDYNIKNYNELGRQDESYYVIVAGHGAKTYLGFNEDIDPEEFIDLAKKSEKDNSVIDYQKYINAIESKPGVQVMIPAGTIHASGRNQLILEIGSLTIGSYTYKMYDYLRLDLDGKPRPIHTYHGNNVLARERNTTWVNQNIVQKPRVVREGPGYREKILGEHDLLYFSLRDLEFDKEIEDNTNGKFHVLSLVDGHKVLIQSIDHPEMNYHADFLDIVCVPASVGRYKIVNLGPCPVIIHKTMLKDGFENEEQFNSGD